MTSSISARTGVARALGTIVVTSLLSGFLPSRATSAPAETPASTEPAPPPTAATQASAAESANRKAWRAAMSRRIPLPKKGCFKGTYPSTEWEEIPCITPPRRPYTPVGSGNDYAAQVSPPITTAEGSFDSVTGVTSESGNVYSADDRCDLKHSNVPNAFSLQLNTNRFTNSSNNVPACNGAASPAGCAGVQQFVFDNQGCLDPSGNPKPCLFIYYFLLDYGKACPTGWTQPPGNSGEIDCTNNSDYAAPIPVQNIADLAKLNLTGRAEGGMDTVTLQTASDDVYALQADSVFNLAQNWQYAEFNVFGTGCGSQANFNIGATIVVRTSVFNGTMSGPTCARGITAETNNLDLLPPCCSIGGTSPAIKFKESNALGVTSTCQCQAVEEGCLGSGDCCSGNCILGTCHCSPLFTGACSTVDDCCGNKSAVECKNGICAPFTGPPTCGGHPHPPQPCSLGWRCCDDNVWTCGLCQ